MLRKNVKSLLEQFQVCIFREIVFGVRCTLSNIVQFQKISILPPQKGLEGSVRPKILKKCMKFNWNFQRGGGS